MTHHGDTGDAGEADAAGPIDGLAPVTLREMARGAAPVGDLAIGVHGLRMRYGSVDVLRGVDLAVAPREVVAILGPNGAGKTTTVEVLEGFRRRSAGHVHVLGADPDTADEHWRARVGVVLQGWRDHQRWRVRELLKHLGRFYAAYSTSDHVRPRPVDELLDRVGLRRQAMATLETLSGGQRRRLDVAIGLLGRPELLFLDEPTAGFDPEGRQDFHHLIQELSGAEDMTIVLTTHDLAEAEKLADRIVLLVDGRVLAAGTVAELSQELGGSDEVRYRVDGRAMRELVADGTEHVRRLFEVHGARLSELEVRRPHLEDTYLALVREHESATVSPTATPDALRATRRKRS